MLVLHVLCYALLAFPLIVYLFLRKWFSYWSDRGVLQETPHLFYGNTRELGKSQSIQDVITHVYEKLKGRAPFCGINIYLRRSALILDLDLIKQVLIKDFDYFINRGNYYNEKASPLSAHLFNLAGEKWRHLRTKLTPTFTSGKIKYMQPTVVQVGQQFVQTLEQMLSHTGSDIEMRELSARFTTDVIGTCAFGLECNSLKDPQAEFRVMGRRAITDRRHGRIMHAFIQTFPNIARKLGVKGMLPDDIADFFMHIVRETVEYRERENIKRNDFMNLLIEMKQKKELEHGLTIEEIAAQAFVFFLAGYETSSNTMGFALHELALHQDIQDRARLEIETTLREHGDVLTYDAMMKLKYLKQIFQETLRLFPVLPILQRQALKDHPVSGTKHVIEKGIFVTIPVHAIHHDADLYPEPEVFNPDRFLPEEIQKRSSVAWLPFGDGPRNCIGLRFGEMQALIGLALLLKNFRFRPSVKTKIPIVLQKSSFLANSEGGIVLTVEKI